MSLNFAVLEATEPDQLTEGIQQIFGLQAHFDKARRGRFDARMDIGVGSNVNMLLVKATNLEACVPDGQGIDFTTVSLPLRGEVTMGQGTFRAEPVPVSADITPHCDPLRVKCETTTTMVLRLDNPLLEEATAKLSGGRRVTDSAFDSVLHLRGQAGRMLTHRANLMWNAIHTGELQDQTQIRVVELELATDFLLAAETDCPPALGAHDDAPFAAAMQRVEEWIFANFAEPISRADLCDISGLHVRTLTRGMQLAHGVGPMQFVREVRLDAIRQVLLCGRPEETSVTRIAEDFGMSHLGRFSKAYQRRFCERPVDTLKRY
ncbi:MAG: helix-turn-helix domain-containing protein [Pseudomonadales bacterium]